MNIFLCAFGSLALAIIGAIFVAKSGANELRMLQSGLSNTVNSLKNNQENKAQMLKNKPYAEDPMKEFAGDVGNKTKGIKMAAKMAGAIGSKIPGMAGMALNVGKVGLGTAAAVGEFVNKKTGLTRRISGFMKPIGKKIRFKAASAAGFLKDQFETEGDRLRNRFNQSKEIIGENLNNMKNSISSKIPTGAKRKIKRATSFAKFYGKWAKEKAISIGSDFKDTVGLYKDEFSQMAKGISNAKKEAWRDFSSTKGFGIAKEGMDNIKEALKKRRGNISFTRPARLPNLQFNANRGTLENIIDNCYQEKEEKDEIKLKSESLTEAIKEYRRFKGNSSKDALIARRYAQALNELNNSQDARENEIKQNLLFNFVSNSPNILSKDKLVTLTNEMYNYYNNNGMMAKLHEAQSEAIKQNSKVPMSEIISAFNNNSNARNQLNRDAQNSGNYNEFETDVYKEIAEDITKGEIGERAVKYFGKDGAKQLSEKIQTTIQDNITSDFVNRKDSIIGEIQKEKSLSRTEAREYVNDIMNGAFDQDSLKATIEHFVKEQGSQTQPIIQQVASSTPTTQAGSQQTIIQQTVVQQPQQVIQQTVAQQPQQVTQQTVSQQSTQQTSSQQSASQASAQQTSSQPSVSQPSVQQVSAEANSRVSSRQSESTNSRNTNTVHTTERIIERANGNSLSKEALNGMTRDITNAIQNSMREDINKNIGNVLSAYKEKFDVSLKELENSIKNNGILKEFYEAIGSGSEIVGKRRFKDLYSKGGTFDQLLETLQSAPNESNDEPIKNTRGKRRKKADDDVA